MLLHAFAMAGAHAGSWEIGINARHEDLREFARGGDTLVRETGWAHALSVVYRSPLAVGEWMAGIEAGQADLDYAGRTQRGRPVESSTTYRRYRASLGYEYPVNATSRITTLLETEWLDRDIHGVGNIAGLRENYRSHRLLLGGARDWIRDGHPVTLGIDLIRGLSGSQRVHSHGVVDPVSLPEGDSLGFRVKLALPMPMQTDAPITMTLFAETLRVERGKSRPWRRDGQVMGSITQPEYRRDGFGLALTTRW